LREGQEFIAGLIAVALLPAEGSSPPGSASTPDLQHPHGSNGATAAKRFRGEMGCFLQSSLNSKPSLFLKEKPCCVILWSNRILVPNKAIVYKLKRRQLSPGFASKISLEKPILVASVGNGDRNGIEILRNQHEPLTEHIKQFISNIKPFRVDMYTDLECNTQIRGPK
jgi:hypothetical protein